MCTVLLPPGVNPIAVNKYIIQYHEFQRILKKRDNINGNRNIRETDIYDIHTINSLKIKVILFVKNA